MPRKHLHKWNHYKPTAPPSAPVSAPATTSSSTAASVNTLLAHLRTSQSHHHHYDDNNDLTQPLERLIAAPSIPPHLQSLLGTVLPPPPRPRLRAGGPTHRGGPPPPPSWLFHASTVPPTTTATATATATSSTSPFSTSLSTAPHHPSLPGLAHPPRTSLAHFALLTLARTYQRHPAHHLAPLPPHLKALLLSYLPAPPPAEFLYQLDTRELTHLVLTGVNASTVLWLFPRAGTPEAWDQDEDESAGAAATHVCLGGATGEVGRLLERVKGGATHVCLRECKGKGLVKGLRTCLGLAWVDVAGCPGMVQEMLAEREAWRGPWRGVRTVIVGECAEELRRHVVGVRGGGGGAFEVVIVGSESDGL